jgi:hypothetical protein
MNLTADEREAQKVLAAMSGLPLCPCCGRAVEDVDPDHDTTVMRTFMRDNVYVVRCGYAPEDRVYVTRRWKSQS